MRAYIEGIGLLGPGLSGWHAGQIATRHLQGKFTNDCRYLEWTQPDSGGAQIS